jgi:hypothetical protein
VRRQEFADIKVHGNARPLDNRLSGQNPRVRNDSLLVDSLFFFHMTSLYHMDAIDTR